MKMNSKPFDYGKGFMKRILTFSLGVILLITYGKSSFALSVSFLDEIEAGNYLKAVEIYKSDILGNATKEMQAQDDIAGYLDNSVNQFINNELTDQEIRAIFYTVEKVNNEVFMISPDELENCQLLYREVRASKANYSEAITLMEREDYKSAVEFFGYVSTYDTSRYEAAQRKIRECSMAICNHLLDEAEALAIETKYKEAFELAEKIVSEYPDISYVLTVRDRYSSLYVNQAIREAKELYQSTGDSDQAGAVLRRCLGTVGDNEELEQVITWFESRKPVSLTEIPSAVAENHGLKKSYLNRDIFGTVYEDYPVVVAAGFPGRKTLPSSGIFYLNGEYKTFTGTIFLSDCFKNTKNKGFVRIYGDGALLFEENEIKQGYRTSNFTIDVTGVQKLKVELSAWYDDTGGLYDYEEYELYPCLTNAVVMK